MWNVYNLLEEKVMEISSLKIKVFGVFDIKLCRIIVLWINLIDEIICIFYIGWNFVI